ncbi:hypothetical protein ABMZ76_00350 [Morganella morganii]|uniref:hypothetical protein n=1 Tax=Morganella morganii TaxID=582 RepID=UPI0031B62D2D
MTGHAENIIQFPTAIGGNDNFRATLMAAYHEAPSFKELPVTPAAGTTKFLGTNNKLATFRVSSDSINEGNTMSITRDELDSKLAMNKAEVDAIAAGMREEMAKWREQQNTQMSQLNATLTAMSAKVDSKFEILSSAIGGIDKSLNSKIDGIDKSLNAKIDGVNGSLSGKIEGINTAVSGIQSGISTKLTIFSVVIAGIIAMAGWWFSSNQPQPVPVAQQPIVIYAQQPDQAAPQEPIPEPQKTPTAKQ